MRRSRLHRRTRRSLVALGVITGSIAWSGSADAAHCTVEVIGPPHVNDLSCYVYGSGTGSCIFDDETGFFYEVIVRCTEIAVVVVRAD